MRAKSVKSLKFCLYQLQIYIGLKDRFTKTKRGSNQEQWRA